MKNIITIMLLSINLTAAGTNYYVRNGGSDTNSGLTDAQAWANHPWMSTWSGSTILKPGDTVFMKSGDKWSIANPTAPYVLVKQSGNPDNYITTTAYGAGAKPIIEISTNTQQNIIFGCDVSFIIIDNLEIKHWSSSKISGNYYGIRLGSVVSNGVVSHDWVITNCDIHNVPSVGIFATYDAYNIVIGDTTATTTATPTSYSNHIHDCGFAGIYMAGCDPSTGNSNYYVYYNYIHDINIEGADEDVCYGINFSSGPTSNGVVKYSYARYNCIKNIPSWTGIDCHSGYFMYFQDNYLYNCKLPFGCQAFTYDDFDSYLWDLYIERNVVEQPQDFKFSQCYFAHITGENSHNRALNVYVRDNIYFYTDRPTGHTGSFGIKLDEVDGAIIAGNHIYNGPRELSSGAINPRTYLKNVTIRNNYIDGWSPAIFLNPTSLDGDVNIHNNIIYSEDRGILSQGTGAFIGNISIYNNSILINPIGSTLQPISFYNTAIPVGSSLKIKNNIIGFVKPYNSGRYILAPNTITGTLEIDHNLYWNCTSSESFYLDGIFSWLAWNNRGYDIHSINNVDPLFRNLSGSFLQDLDFELQSNSSAIDKGIYVGLINDYLDFPVTGSPDIGAFENQIGSYTPAFICSFIEDATPSLLEITYNVTLSDIIPAATSFTVQVDKVYRTVTSVTISGNRVRLTLASPVVFGDSITLFYHKPINNWLQSVSGGEAANITNQMVSNKCLDPVFLDTEKNNVIIYPNPASEYINIFVKETALAPDQIWIVDFSGRTVYEGSSPASINNIALPGNLQEGIYIVKLLTDGVTMFAQKLLISR